ncbi:hypothetical protein [Bifidobacterium magnum]|uniref:Uncharacterized protein n=1 Tax=Bifidobacterium magnum TaxID=1692 RepID=A0A087B9P0_9BIFI|nr:hypothetical protein [Bifidobacterium magnum]KFI67740.1 hypothetical protein BMAGN_1550 [Bifidobacterium magnum]
MTSEIEEMIGEMGYKEASQKAAYAQMLIRRLETVVKAFKTVYEDQIESAETVNINGSPAATITKTRGGDGSWVVEDPKAYGRVLKDIKAAVEEKALPEAWETIPMPREEACTQDYIERLIRDHDGQVPPGVVHKPGRAGSVQIKPDRAFLHQPLTPETISEPFQLTESSQA